MKLKDVNALVTGGSRGLGFAIAERFTLEGAWTFTCSRGHTQGPEYNRHYEQRDVAQYNHVLDMGNGAQWDVLVLNAGIYGPIGPFETNSIQQWKDCIETNLMGVVNCCHAFLPGMKERKKGKIIIVSGGGATRPRPNFSAYATSKAAVVRFMECLAEEVKSFGIDVNCMAPGLLNTTIHDETLKAGLAAVGASEYINAQIARGVEPDFSKACDLAVWLASPESNGITGKLISVHHDYRSLNK